MFQLQLYNVQFCIIVLCFAHDDLFDNALLLMVSAFVFILGIIYCLFCPINVCYSIQLSRITSYSVSYFNIFCKCRLVWLFTNFQKICPVAFYMLFEVVVTYIPMLTCMLQVAIYSHNHNETKKSISISCEIFLTIFMNI